MMKMSKSALALGSAVWLLLPALAGFPALAADPAEAAAADDDGAASERIDSIRDDLVELRFEKALAAIEAMVNEPGLAPAERAELLVLRSQARVAFGDLDAAERDFAEILQVQPGFRPDPSLTPKKAMERFAKVQRQTVGWIELTLDPPDAVLTVDGRTVLREPGGELALVAGEHELRASLAGFDAAVRPIEVTAGEATPLELQLVPNARTVIVRTEPAGVQVALDGEVVGSTVRPDDGVGPGGELVLENVPLGEHAFTLSKPCFRTERLNESLTVDLLDRSPRRLRAVAMAPAHARLVLVGGPEGARVAVDGESVGRLPLEPLTICPGERVVSVRHGGRLVWRESSLFVEGDETRLEVLPRPNLVLVGAEDWPRGLEELADRFNLAGAVGLPAGVELSSPDGWSRVELPSGTDLALAVVPAVREGMRDDWMLYSPILRVAREIERPPAPQPRPRWRHPVWGLTLVDSRIGGDALVVEVAPGGPAASAGLGVGDRITSVDGKEVALTEDVERAFAAAAGESPVPVTWTSRAGEAGEAALTASWTPAIAMPPDDAERAMQLAGWAVVDSICSPRDSSAALSSLALLFSEFGHHDLAAETWRRVRWGNRDGIGEGTTQYYLARELERLGREDEATAAYRRAAASSSTAFHDEGPSIAPAARDRLADLGVSENGS
jgi:hypothetical protein